MNVLAAIREYDRSGAAVRAGLRVVGALLCGAAAASAAAAQPASAASAALGPTHASADERVRIASEREAAIRRFDAEEAACHRRFAVTLCVEEVRDRRRAALADLRSRELSLDEAERRARAQRRLQEIAAREAAAASHPAPEAVVLPATPSVVERSGSAASPVEASAPVAGASRTPADADQAARRALAAEQRRVEAEEVRRRIEAREAERAARGRVAVPLPVPPAASAPR